MNIKTPRAALSLAPLVLLSALMTLVLACGGDPEPTPIPPYGHARSDQYARPAYGHAGSNEHACAAYGNSGPDEYTRTANGHAGSGQYARPTRDAYSRGYP